MCNKFFYAMCKIDDDYLHKFKKNEIYYCELNRDNDLNIITIEEHENEYFYNFAFYQYFYTEKEYRMIKLKKIYENRV